MYSGYGNEIKSTEIDSCNLEDYFPKDIADIIDGQLDGYGYYAGLLNGKLVRCDSCYSNNGITEYFECTPKDLLEDAIDFRTELLCEEYNDEYDETDPSVIELHKMEDYLDMLERE